MKIRQLLKRKENKINAVRHMFVYTLPEKKRQAPVVFTSCDWTRILDERLSGSWADCVRS